MKGRTTALVLTAVLVLYLGLLGVRAVWLLQNGTSAAIGLGAGVLVLLVVGGWVAVASLRFGARVQRLARTLAAEGTLPDTTDLPRRPSGRVDRAVAQAWFGERRAELDVNPADWRRWYRLAHAYDLAGDRRRARETMREAIRLADA